MKMTKLMIAATIVCVAAFAQAASIRWKSDFNYITAGGAVQTSETADVGTFVLVYLGNGIADWNNATVVNEGTVSYGVSKGVTSSKVSGDYSFVQGAAGAPINGDIFAVMFKDGDGNLSKLQSNGTPIDKTLVVAGLDSNTWSTTFTFADGNFSAAPTSTPPGGGSGDIPEPTSGLLLVVGGAILALRRRRE